MKKQMIKSLYDTITETRSPELKKLSDFFKEIYKYNVHTLSTEISINKLMGYIYENDTDTIFDFLYRLKYNLLLANCEDALQTVSKLNKNDKLFLKSKYIDKTLSAIMTYNFDNTDEFVELVVLLRLNINYVIKDIIFKMEGNDDVPNNNE